MPHHLNISEFEGANRDAVDGDGTRQSCFLKSRLRPGISTSDLPHPLHEVLVLTNFFDEPRKYGHAVLQPYVQPNSKE